MQQGHVVWGPETRLGAGADTEGASPTNGEMIMRNAIVLTLDELNKTLPNTVLRMIVIGNGEHSRTLTL